MEVFKYNKDVLKPAFIATINEREVVLSTDIKNGDEVVRFIDRPVSSYWSAGVVSGIYVIRNSMSCGCILHETWYKIIAVL